MPSHQPIEYMGDHVYNQNQHKIFTNLNEFIIPIQET